MDEELLFEPEPNLDDLESARTSDDPRFHLAMKLLRQTQEQLGQAIRLLERGEDLSSSNLLFAPSAEPSFLEEDAGFRVLEGVFNGEAMVASDGHVYPVPANYASKSCLVEGDLLKLTVKPDGSFVYKQIGPMERARRVGRLVFEDASNHYGVLCEEDQFYKILTACVTYFKGEPGDEVVILVPKDAPSLWAAVEAMVKK